MPSDLVRRIDLDHVYPRLLTLFLECLSACRARGADYWAVSGYRNFSQQASLYFQGRTMPGAKVTNAGPGFSWHNYGAAIDVARDKDVARAGLQPEWADAGAYRILKEEGERLGLQVGVPSVPGGDPGHVSLPFGAVTGRAERALLGELRKIHLEDLRKESLPACWERMDAWLG